MATCAERGSTSRTSLSRCENHRFTATNRRCRQSSAPKLNSLGRHYEDCTMRSRKYVKMIRHGSACGRRKDVTPSELSVQVSSAKPLPKMLPGSVCVQWVRCGRPNCRCAKGRLHGPYHYHFWREGGKLRKQYVKPEAVEDMRERCEARRRHRQKATLSNRRFRDILSFLEGLMNEQNDAAIGPIAGRIAQ